MTELLVSRGDTFPRSFLDTYRTSKTARNDDFYNDLKSSKSDELVLQNTDIPVVNEIYHRHSENLLDSAGCMSPTEGNFLDKPDVMTLPNRHKRRVPVYDKVDPEDSIRDIVSENDFYRFVLFKKHYDKYLHLSQKYEEARNIAYYLEEKYHEVKTERDDLLQQREHLVKRLESNECLVKEKEDEVFVQLERVVYLEEQCDKLKAEKEKCVQQKLQLEKERDQALRLLKEQAKESEINRRKLEKARQEVITHMTKIRDEKEHLERENDQLKETLEAERKGIGRYLSTIQRKPIVEPDYFHRGINELKLVAHHNAALSSQFQKAMRHLATCKRRKCSVCSYTKAAFGIPQNPKYDRKLFSCLQTPFQEMRNMIKPPPSPISAEGESLSEWFRPLCSASVSSSECSSLSIPFAELAITFMDDTSDSISRCRDIDEKYKEDQDGLSRTSQACASIRGFGSDSGFASDFCPEYKSNGTTPKEKFNPKATLDEADCAKLTRTKWTASFRKLINRIKK